MPATRLALMKSLLLLALPVVPTFAQLPESIPYYSRLAAENGLTNLGEMRLSPNGRLIAFDAASAPDDIHIWVAPLNGGPLVQVTKSARWEMSPRWSASGDRLSYFSGPSDGGGIMIISVDPNTGRPTGTPRRVTTEPIDGGPGSRGKYAFSPDGQWIAYRTHTDRLGGAIRVVPSVGGPARTLVGPIDGYFRFMQYDRDGRYLYFVQHAARTHDATLARVPTSGGAIEPLIRVPRRFAGVPFDVDANRVLIREADSSQVHVLDLNGDTLTTITLAQGASLPAQLAFTPDGNSLIAGVEVITSSIRVMPVTGGASRLLAEVKDDVVHLYGWRGDKMFFRSRSTPVPSWVGRGGGQGRVNVSLAGIQRTARETWWHLSYDALTERYFPVVVEDPDSVSKLYIYDQQSRQARQIDRDFRELELTTNGGQDWTIDGELVYASGRGKNIEIKSTSLSGGQRVIRRVTLSDSGGNHVAIGRDRHAEGVRNGTERSVLISVRNAPARKVTLTPNGLIWDMSFSPDDRVLFVRVNDRVGNDFRLRGAFLRIGHDGNLSQPIRWVDLPGLEGPAHWTSDSRSLISTGVRDRDTRIWRIPAESGPPQFVAQTDEPIRDFRLSPDGHQIALLTTRSSGFGLWRIDVGAARNGVRR